MAADAWNRPGESRQQALNLRGASGQAAYAEMGSELDAGSPARSLSSRQRRDLMQLAIGYGLILLVIWTPRPYQAIFYVTAIISILVTTWLSFEGWNAMGVRRGGLLRSSWILCVALLAAFGAVALAGQLHTLHEPHGIGHFIGSFAGYVVWSFFQQFLLQAFVLMRLLRLLRSRATAVWIAAALFALAHLPNPVLTVATLAWGWASCWLFLRYRNLYVLGAAHAILGISIAITVPGAIHHNMRVGLGYWTYHPRSHRSQSDHTVSTRVWVKAEAPTLRS